MEPDEESTLKERDGGLVHHNGLWITAGYAELNCWEINWDRLVGQQTGYTNIPGVEAYIDARRPESLPNWNIREARISPADLTTFLTKQARTNLKSGWITHDGKQPPHSPTSHPSLTSSSIYEAPGHTQSCTNFAWMHDVVKYYIIPSGKYGTWSIEHKAFGKLGPSGTFIFTRSVNYGPVETLKNDCSTWWTKNLSDAVKEAYFEGVVLHADKKKNSHRLLVEQGDWTAEVVCGHCAYSGE
ncbi:hypothetical protein CC86DRAFT_386377 [Ophiobolus disseminans]|uniref:Uncharacterized protein n=1 Tax=Ophiobolus disseminans TaxID=1469910 RepID=A0A6A6ZL80_9PLEO|nr:hypothetical protein CC86DRAFT_386377 [Ophiobolus disseminans]